MVGAAAIIDRGADAAKLGLPLQSLVKLEVQSWPPDQCPLCAQGHPITKPGLARVIRGR